MEVPFVLEAAALGVFLDLAQHSTQEMAMRP
jgi:hypothetical protein